MTDLIEEIKEKFIRCPYCRSYSVRKDDRKNVGFSTTEYYICDNCGKSFTFDIEEGISRKIVNKKKNKFFYFIPFLLVFLIGAWLYFYIFRSNENIIEGKKKNQTVNKIVKENKYNINKENSQDKNQISKQNKDNVNVDQNKQEDITNKDLSNEDIKKEEEIKIMGEINFYNSSKFGVNWIAVEKGVKVIRLSNGPLRKAGVKIGDIIVEVNGEKATNAKLMSYKNKVFRRELESVLVVVLRGNAKLYFKMVKKNPLKNDLNSNKLNNSNQTNKSYLIKVASSLKIRMSSPDKETPEKKWNFSVKNFNIKRKNDDVVLISGDKTGNKPWNVDAELVINNKIFKGYSFTKDYAYKNIPEKFLQKPIDITNMIPPNKMVNVKVQLVDYGILWGNTDLYLVIKKKEL